MEWYFTALFSCYFQLMLGGMVGIYYCVTDFPAYSKSTKAFFIKVWTFEPDKALWLSTDFSVKLSDILIVNIRFLDILNVIIRDNRLPACRTDPINVVQFVLISCFEINVVFIFQCTCYALSTSCIFLSAIACVFPGILGNKISSFVECNMTETRCLCKGIPRSRCHDSHIWGCWQVWNCYYQYQGLLNFTIQLKLHSKWSVFLVCGATVAVQIRTVPFRTTTFV